MPGRSEVAADPGLVACRRISGRNGLVGGGHPCPQCGQFRNLQVQCSQLARQDIPDMGTGGAAWLLDSKDVADLVYG